MSRQDRRKRTEEPTYWDYVKAAFSARFPVRGLGAVPLNWIFVAVVAVASLKLLPLALLGAGIEIAYLAVLSNSGRFQRMVRANRQREGGEAVAQTLERLVASLPARSQSRYRAFEANCAQVLEIARRVATASPESIATYESHLVELRGIYIRMLTLLEMLAQHSADWERLDPLPQMRAVEQELSQSDLPERIRRSREATLEILKRRAQSRQDISERAQTLSAELERLDQQVALLREQALLTRDPTFLSETMDATAGVLEEHTAWLQENEAIFGGVEETSVAG